MRLSVASQIAARSAIARGNSTLWYLYSKGSTDTGFGTVANPQPVLLNGQPQSMHGHMRVLRAIEVPKEYQAMQSVIYRFDFIDADFISITTANLIGNQNGSLLFNVLMNISSPDAGQLQGALILSPYKTS